MNPNAIRVKVRLFDRNAIKAFADVTVDAGIGDITIQGFRVVQVDGKEAWVGFPQSSYVKDGRPVNKPILDLTRSQQDLIANAVLAAYRRALGEAQVAPLPARKAG